MVRSKPTPAVEPRVAAPAAGKAANGTTLSTMSGPPAHDEQSQRNLASERCCSSTYSLCEPLEDGQLVRIVTVPPPGKALTRSPGLPPTCTSAMGKRPRSAVTVVQRCIENGLQGTAGSR